MSPKLEPLRFLVGSCWTGPFPGGKVTDTHCFAPMQDGVYVRDVHAIKGGPQAYGGETLYAFDAAAGRIDYAYYASDGGRSRGSVKSEGGALVFPDTEYVGADGKRMAMRARWTPDGPDAYVAVTEVQTPDGEWAPFNTIRFVRDPR